MEINGFTTEADILNGHNILKEMIEISCTFFKITGCQVRKDTSISDITLQKSINNRRTILSTYLRSGKKRKIFLRYVAFGLSRHEGGIIKNILSLTNVISERKKTKFSMEKKLWLIYHTLLKNILSTVQFQRYLRKVPKNWPRRKNE